VAKRGEAAFWAAVELFHTPPCAEAATWELAARSGGLDFAEERWPWCRLASESGRWQLQENRIIDIYVPPPA
jgi:hypothetical protein